MYILNRFTNTESELPVILNAHNEEIRVLRSKMKQVKIFLKYLSFVYINITIKNNLKNITI